MNKKTIISASDDIARKLEILAKEKENSQKAILNVLEDLKIEEEKLIKDKVKDEAMLASIGDGVIATDQEGKVIVINKVAEDFLGFTKIEIVGKLFVQVVSQQDGEGNKIPDKLRPITLALNSGITTITTNYHFVCKDGTKFPAAITVTPIILDSKTVGAIIVFRDITKEKEIDKAKTEFVSLASHQLRTPLGIIKWYLEALENEDYFKNAPQAVRKYFDEIYKSNERVLSLMRDLLSVSRIDQGKVKNTPKPADVLQIVKEIVEQMKIIAREKKITLRLTIQDHKIPSINIDILRLHEVVENLIVNAIEYSEATDSVDVTVKKTGDALLISVKDTGIGISKADQKNLFTKFFRSEKAVKHNPEGVGLGLYVVKSYVEGWGGKISVESVEGIGSTFTISLSMKSGVILNV